MSGIRRVRRLIYLIALLFCFALVGMRGASLWAEYQAALDRTEASARDLARIVEEYARRTFETSDLIADAVAAQVAALGGTAALRGNAAASRWLRGLAERTSGDHLLVVDAAGVPVAATA